MPGPPERQGGRHPGPGPGSNAAGDRWRTYRPGTSPANRLVQLGRMQCPWTSVAPLQGLRTPHRGCKQTGPTPPNKDALALRRCLQMDAATARSATRMQPGSEPSGSPEEANDRALEPPQSWACSQAPQAPTNVASRIFAARGGRGRSRPDSGSG